MSKTTLTAGRPSLAAGSRTATLAKLADKADTVRVNFDLEREQHTRLKIYAARQGRTIRELLTEMVKQLPE